MYVLGEKRKLRVIFCARFLLLYGHVSKSGICVNCYSYVTAEVVKTNNFLD